ncbi:MAG: Ku domain protein [Bryobacterales bacterium]|jgi:DNA end-binding protein Ku|nr:Ku domain protein [Bryobacterales bacterium]
MATTVWRGYITFGLISIPVRLFRAARSERVSLRQLYRVPARLDGEPDEDARPERQVALQPAQLGPSSSSGRVVEAAGPEETVAPVRRVAVSQTDNEILPEAAVTKGYEVEKDHYVTLDAHELKAIEPRTATEMELLEFVKLSDVDPIFFETSYYVRPEEAGQKSYALLYESLRRTGLVALGKFAMHRREHITILRSGKSGLIAHTMYFAPEVRADQEYRADTKLINSKELALANTLVNSLSGEFEPEKYRDTYREQLEKLIASKAAGKTMPAVREPRRTAAAIDITEALKKSLAQLKKPPAKSAAAPRSSHRKTAKGG